MDQKTILSTTFAVAVVASLLWLGDIHVPSPPDWLTRWTTWAITFIALLKAPGFANALIARLDKQ